MNTSGTSYQGEIYAHFNALEDLFGKPNVVQDGKTTYEWVIKMPNEQVATIYDYKRDPHNSDEEALWHVGGFDKYASGYIEAKLEEYYLTN